LRHGLPPMLNSMAHWSTMARSQANADGLLR
jgi:hypothetical protein